MNVNSLSGKPSKINQTLGKNQKLGTPVMQSSVINSDKVVRVVTMQELVSPGAHLWFHSHRALLLTTPNWFASVLSVQDSMPTTASSPRELSDTGNHCLFSSPAYLV